MRCNNQVYPKDENGKIISTLVNTYCTLPKGHIGECEPFSKANNQCMALHEPTGQSCAYPIGHTGRHKSRADKYITW